MFLAVFVIGLVLGPAAQGEFSRYKAETEFAAAFGMLGLPQALFFFTKSGALAAERAARIAKLGALLCAPIALVYGFLNSSWLNGASCVAFALAVTMMIWQGNLRGVVLARSTVRQFNFITALPQMLLLTYAFAAVAFGRVRNLDMGLAFAIAFGMGTLIGTGALRATCAARQESWISSVRIGEVATYGLASGLTTVAATM